MSEENNADSVDNNNTDSTDSTGETTPEETPDTIGTEGTPDANATDGDGDKKSGDSLLTKDTGKSGDDATDTTDTDTTSTAPDKYEEFTLPEGFTMNEESFNEASKTFKELGLSQDAAQKLIDLQASESKGREEADKKSSEALFKQFEKELREDSDFGGDKFDENMGLARKALDEFGSQGLKEKLDIYGMGNDPDYIRFMRDIGKALSEDSFVSGASTQTEKSVAETLYPGMTKKQ